MTGVIKTDANGVIQTNANGVIQTVSSATPQFEVAIASTTSPVSPGDELGVTADVTNTGGAQGTQTITLDINNGVGQVDSASVTLSAGGSTTQALSWSVPSGQTEQDYTATVSSADDSASQTVTVSDVSATQITRPTDNSTNSVTGRSGFVFNPNEAVSGLKAEISANTSGVTEAYISETNGTVLASTDISGSSAGDTISVSVSGSLTTGTDYMFLLDASGGEYTQGIHDSSSYPLTGAAFDITERAFKNAPQGGGNYLAFNNIRSLNF